MSYTNINTYYIPFPFAEDPNSYMYIYLRLYILIFGCAREQYTIIFYVGILFLTNLVHRHEGIRKRVPGYRECVVPCLLRVRITGRTVNTCIYISGYGKLPG